MRWMREKRKWTSWKNRRTNSGQAGPLSQGIMHGHSVTCPLHNWKIDLTNGEALAPDEGCSNVFVTKVDAGKVYLQLSQD